MSIKDHKHIVFCEESYNPLGIIRSLGESGIRSIVIALKTDESFILKSKYIDKYYIVESVEKGYEILVTKYANSQKRPFIYTSDDTITDFLNNKYDDIINDFYFYNAGIKGQVAKYVNKKNIYDLAMKNGFNVLEETVIKTGQIPKGIEYPIITKAVTSTEYGWKKNMHICNSEEELKNAFSKIEVSEIMIQKYIHKKNELCLEGFSANHGNDLFIAIASQYKYLLPDRYSPYMNVKNFNNTEMFNKLNEMFKEIGFEGIFEIEFLIDKNNKLYFGEINFRNSTWSYAATCAGMNLPLGWAESMLTGKITKNYRKKIPSGYVAMNEFDDFKNRVRSHQISLLKWIKDFKNSQCKYYYGKNDIKPFLAAINIRIKRKIINKRRYE